MGEVYEARDTRLERTVAIKVLPEHLADSPERKERFGREGAPGRSFRSRPTSMSGSGRRGSQPCSSWDTTFNRWKRPISFDLFRPRPNGIVIDEKSGTLLAGVNQLKPAQAIGL